MRTDEGKRTSTTTARPAFGRIHTVDARATLDVARPERVGARLAVAVLGGNGYEGFGLPFQEKSGMLEER